MSKIVQDTDGHDIEVFTKEEFDAQRESAIEEYKVANPVNTEEIDALQKELKETQAKLAGFENKDLNFANLRQQKEAAEKKSEDLVKEIDAKIGAMKKEVLEGVTQDHYNETIKILAGTDEELKKKIEFQYKRLQDPVATKEEVTKKLTDAWVLATKPESVNALNSSVISSGGVSRVNVQTDKKFTPEEKVFAQKLAASGGIKLEDKDFK